MRAQGLCRLGKDAEVRYTPNGDAVANLSLAFNFRSGKEQATQWIDASLWGKRAESLAPYLLKGGQVVAYLDDVHIQTFEGKNGAGHKLVGRVADIELVSNKTQGAQDMPSHPAAPVRGVAAMDDLDSDVPF